MSIEKPSNTLLTPIEVLFRFLIILPHCFSKSLVKRVALKLQ